jgi:hypothetical protein
MIAATFHGPNHFVPNYDETVIEVYDNIGHAISALFDRYESNGTDNLPVTYLNGGNWRVPFPHVELGDWFECYHLNVNWRSSPLRDEAVEDVLTAVHAGLWSYKLQLRRPFNLPGDPTTVAVSVEKRVK